jgi:dihydroorotase
MPGVQTLVPVMLDHVNKGRLSLARFVDLTSAGPQRIFGIAGKGRIAVGYDADLTIVDLKLQKTITDDWIASKCGWTPFAGRNVQGWPVGTILRGNIAMWDGELGQPSGAPVRFDAALRSCEYSVQRSTITLPRPSIHDWVHSPQHGPLASMTLRQWHSPARPRRSSGRR